MFKKPIITFLSFILHVHIGQNIFLSCYIVKFEEAKKYSISSTDIYKLQFEKFQKFVLP
jgi:hypothetical protein